MQVSIYELIFTCYAIIIFIIILSLFINNSYNLENLSRDSDDDIINDKINNKRVIIKDLFNFKILNYFINKNECDINSSINSNLSLDINSNLINYFITITSIVMTIIALLYITQYFTQKFTSKIVDKNNSSDKIKSNNIEDKPNYFDKKECLTIYGIWCEHIIFMVFVFICIFLLIAISIYIKLNYNNEELIKNIKAHYIINDNNNFLHNIIKKEWDLIKNNTKKDEFKLLLKNSNKHNIVENIKYVDKYDLLFKKIFYLCIFLQKQNENTDNDIFVIMSNLINVYDNDIKPCENTFISMFFDMFGYKEYNNKNCNVNEKKKIIILSSLLQSKYLIDDDKKEYDINDDLNDFEYDSSIIKEWVNQLYTELGVKSPDNKKYLTNIMKESKGIIKTSIYMIFIITLILIIFAFLLLLTWHNKIKYDNTFVYIDKNVYTWSYNIYKKKFLIYTYDKINTLFNSMKMLFNKHI